MLVATNNLRYFLTGVTRQIAIRLVLGGISPEPGDHPVGVGADLRPQLYGLAVGVEAGHHSDVKSAHG